MPEVETLAVESEFLANDNEAVIKHMEMYQGIITRMARNSAACKTWGIPVVAAILGFVIEKKGSVDLAFLASVITLILYFLDSYYLMLERRFIAGFNFSAGHIQKGTFTRALLFNLIPMGTEKEHSVVALKSLATWPVYLGLFIFTIGAVVIS